MTNYKDLHNQALEPFRRGEYAQALPLFEQALPLATHAKDRAATLLNLTTSRHNTKTATWESCQEAQRLYNECLHDPESASFPTQPAQNFFNVLCDGVSRLAPSPEEANLFLQQAYQQTPTRFQTAFLLGLQQVFEAQAIAYDDSGHQERAQQLARLFLNLTKNHAESYLQSRIAVRNRLANLLVFHAPKDSKDLYIEADTLLQQSLQDDPHNPFAKRLREYIAQRQAFSLQIDRFWHDTNNRIAPLKNNLRKLTQAPDMPEQLKKILHRIEVDIASIDTSLRISGATQGADKTLQPSPSQYEEIDPVALCREILADSDLPSDGVLAIGQKQMWEIAPDYLRFALQLLFANTKEAYERRKITTPSIPLTLTVDYEQHTITLRDWAGGISPNLSDPFQIYASEKGIHMQSGFGLHQARSAVEAMDGTLTLATTQPDDGAAFVLRFTM